MGEPEVEQFLSYLAVEGQVAASTQNQALAALLFLYKALLNMPLRERIDASRAKRPKRLPVVLTRDELRAVPSHLSGVHHLMASLLYGSGLRLMECLRMRVKDLDFGQNHILVRDGKGQGGALAGFVAWTSQKSDSTGAKKVCSQVQRISSARYLAHFFYQLSVIIDCLQQRSGIVYDHEVDDIVHVMSRSKKRDVAHVDFSSAF